MDSANKVKKPRVKKAIVTTDESQVTAPAPAPATAPATAPTAPEPKKTRAPMTDEAKAAAAAKRAATKAAKVVEEPIAAPEPKTKKPRAPMSDEAKAAAAAKRAATKAAKASVEPEQAEQSQEQEQSKTKKPRAPMTDEAKAAAAAKRAATKAAKQANVGGGSSVAATAPAPPVKAPKGKKPTAAVEPVAGAVAASPKRLYELVDVEGAFFMVNTENQKAYRANLALDGDERALLDQQVGVFKDGEILPIFDDE
jgi:hypothetical protein